MAHKFRLDIGANKYANLPAGSDHSRRAFLPFFRFEFLPSCVRLFSFHVRRGICGGSVTFSGFTVSFPLPKRPRRRSYKIEES